jgi:hypothetical protein
MLAQSERVSSVISLLSTPLAPESITQITHAAEEGACTAPRGEFREMKMEDDLFPIKR